jgi:hypothetical protein
MSDAPSDVSGDEELAMSEDEEQPGIPEPVKAPGVFHAPTTQELVELREGSELFKSNTFKLQVSKNLLSILFWA